MTLRVGIFGGTFDPFHHGHLTLAADFAKRLHLNQLILLPAGQPWQKAHGAGLNQVSAASHRLAMTRLGAAQLKLPETEVIVATDEIERASPSYTVDTLAAWRKKVGAHASLSFLMGADQLIRLDSWHQWPRLFDYAHLCVAARPGFSLAAAAPVIAAEIAQRTAPAPALSQHTHGLILLDTEFALEISATQIRAQLRESRATLNAAAPPFLPAPIWHYILQHHLYQSTS
ncbi:Probable nicotinate-nucleotide adenylyltransferase [Mycoavidus cysteinexigens]|uniref:Probable nicotinate-nucleotide adenylyltransferase n=1 Tax=Mycoavidus cysteinexigens TaxID=1553431 RepID=A0A2Z6EUF7_9BURK|nr:nicotinate-nucleotide adenylyltransferase [Mycoavidus cysteinexigens]BBE09093.1 Probable nicotinate-nucleotide adenylyltransferase [Mycoavidus cysteinexigens]GAM52167.1 nicotinate-nucleotide adenylyltransferase [bacterium endosymbiont of Mortierella elongata FMR23-6]GLR00242.1 putative nicotinate-nucleotide adenylyltransferase [Mycoavidus cysteinexigens]